MKDNFEPSEEFLFTDENINEIIDYIEQEKDYQLHYVSDNPAVYLYDWQDWNESCFADSNALEYLDLYQQDEIAENIINRIILFMEKELNEAISQNCYYHCLDASKGETIPEDEMELISIEIGEHESELKITFEQIADGIDLELSEKDIKKILDHIEETNAEVNCYVSGCSITTDIDLTAYRATLTIDKDRVKDIFLEALEKYVGYRNKDKFVELMLPDRLSKEYMDNIVELSEDSELLLYCYLALFNSMANYLDETAIIGLVETLQGYDQFLMDKDPRLGIILDATAKSMEQCRIVESREDQFVLEFEIIDSSLPLFNNCSLQLVASA